MRVLYYTCKVLIAPLWAISGVLYGLAMFTEWLAGTIHDNTAYRVWLVLHKRACKGGL